MVDIYKDIDFSLNIHPLQKDITILKDIKSINNALKNIILTRKGERIFNPYFGTNTVDIIFENINVITTSELIENITESIKTWETRIKLIQINIYTISENDYTLDIEIIYEYNNQNIETTIKI